MNRQIRQLAVGLMMCYVVLFATLNYWQVAQEQELNANVENTRAVRREFNKPRGDIVSADGVIAATSTPIPDPNAEFDRIREYPTGDLLSNVTGYFTLNFGSTQVERAYGDVLTGNTTEQQLRALGNILASDVDNSGSVELAVRHDLQQVAKFALGGRTGSVVVQDIETGAVRAMYSNPTYDPNTFVTLPFDEAREAIVDLQNAPGDPLLAGAYQQRFMPGSTFKVITTGIGIEAGVIDRTTQFVRESEWVPPQTTNPIQNYRGSTCGGDLPEVFRRSCNIPFAQTAISLGPDRMVAGVDAWGIGEELPIDLPRSRPPARSATPQNLAQHAPACSPFAASVRATTRWSRCTWQWSHRRRRQRRPDDDALRRRGDVRSTPAASLEPHRSPRCGRRRSPPRPLRLRTEFMTGVTEGDRGTARSVQLADGQRFAAKTGTAELGLVGDPDRVHAWMIGFAPLEAPKYSIAVVLTDLTSTQADAATGGREAGPVVKTVLDYLLTGDGANADLSGG